MLRLELTSRQAARVIEQALCNRALLEISPRVFADDEPLSGTLVARDGDLLRVELHDVARESGLTGLAGAFCEVRVVLSDNLYTFTTCIFDLSDSAVPQCLYLGVPDAMQVANRRRFERQSGLPSTCVLLWPAHCADPSTSELVDIGIDGLGLKVSRDELEDILLVGDPVRLRFDLPGTEEIFNVAATVCSKNPTPDPDEIVVGLEFGVDANDARTQRSLERLRAVLSAMATNTTQTEGEE
ncbi:hypothetical protein LCGC14_1335220 [marine sediment metagenome]|uniref:PilZ domain-containing protein n=1 Tax=marine sediment metagenome TaxID=412755 RepID=A0A0F9KFA9_9ZZZZ